jgi:hypothetical protein
MKIKQFAKKLVASALVAVFVLGIMSTPVMVLADNTHVFENEYLRLESQGFIGTVPFPADHPLKDWFLEISGMSAETAYLSVFLPTTITQNRWGQDQVTVFRITSQIDNHLVPTSEFSSWNFRFSNPNELLFGAFGDGIDTGRWGEYFDLLASGGFFIADGLVSQLSSHNLDRIVAVRDDVSISNSSEAANIYLETVIVQSIWTARLILTPEMVDEFLVTNTFSVHYWDEDAMQSVERELAVPGLRELILDARGGNVTTTPPVIEQPLTQPLEQPTVEAGQVDSRTYRLGYFMLHFSTDMRFEERQWENIIEIPIGTAMTVTPDFVDEVALTGDRSISHLGLWYGSTILIPSTPIAEITPLLNHTFDRFPTHSETFMLNMDVRFDMGGESPSWRSVRIRIVEQQTSEYPTSLPDTIGAIVNGQSVNFADQQPANVDGRVLVPVRGVFETLGFAVDWNGEARQATLSRANDIVIITIDSTTFTTNGISHTLDVPAQIIAGSTMLPIRAVLESVGYELEWDGTTQTIIISTN